MRIFPARRAIKMFKVYLRDYDVYGRFTMYIIRRRHIHILYTEQPVPGVCRIVRDDLGTSSMYSLVAMYYNKFEMQPWERGYNGL